WATLEEHLIVTARRPGGPRVEAHLRIEMIPPGSMQSISKGAVNGRTPYPEERQDMGDTSRGLLDRSLSPDSIWSLLVVLREATLIVQHLGVRDLSRWG